MDRSLRERQQKVLRLLDTSGTRLHALLRKLTLSEDAVGDLIQELFIKLANSGGFEKARYPYAYACRTAINLALQWRKKARVKDRSLNEACFPADNNACPLAEMTKNEELSEVLDALPRLSDLARQVLVMHYIEQESYEKIGERLGKKLQHIRSVCAKGLSRMRRLLTAEKNRIAGSELSHG